MKSSIIPPLIGPGPVESVQGDQVLELVRPQPPQDVAHARRFKLEYPACPAFAEKLESQLVVQLDAVRIDVRPVFAA